MKERTIATLSSTLHLGRCGALVTLFALLLGAGAAWADEITISEKPDKFVVQRVATPAGMAGSLSVSGGYTGAPAAVEARVVQHGNGTEVVGWTVVDAAPAGGTWRGTLEAVPQGGWYRLEARFAGAPAVTASGANRFGVGAIIAMIGQSNMVKPFTLDASEDFSISPPYETPHELTALYGYGQPDGFANARPITIDIPSTWGDVVGAGGIHLANDLQAALGVPVLLLDFGRGWSSLHDHWTKTDGSFKGWPPFAAALATVGKVEAVVWHQGAADADDAAVTVTRYKNDLDVLYANVTAIVGDHGSLPMIVAVQNRGDYGESFARDTGYNTVRRAQLEWIAERPYAYSAGNSVDMDLSWLPATGDGHFLAAGYVHMADRYAHAILQATGHPDYQGGVHGPDVVSATLHGDTIYVEVAHDNGARLTVPNPAADVEGFTLTDGPWTVNNGLGPVRNELSVKSTRLSSNADGNHVEIVLNEVPSNPLLLRYLHGQNPFYYKATEELRRRNGNTLRDNFAYFPGRSGLPVNGTTQDVSVAVGAQLLFNTDAVVVPEGGQVMFRVRLSAAPAADVTATASMLEGDSDVTVTGGASLTFTPSNWFLYQNVTLSAAEDADSDAGTAVVRVTAPGYGGMNATATESDNDPVIDPAQVMWLQLDETSGTVALDATLNGHDGAISGGPALGHVGAFGGAFGFDGVDDVVSVPDFPQTPEMTVSLWFNLADNTGVRYKYLYSHGVFGDPNSLNITIGESANAKLPNKLVVNFRDQNDTPGLFTDLLEVDVATAGLIDGLWHQVVFTVKPGVGSLLYVDGQLVASLATHGGNNFNPAGPITVGARADLNFERFYEGLLDDVRLYTRALTAAEIAQGIPGGSPVATDLMTVSVPEGGTGMFQVRLTHAPVAPLQVNVTRAGGDADVTVTGGASLTFTPSNWSTYQSVTLAGGEDTDSIDGSALIRLAVAGYPDREITANEVDNEIAFTVSPLDLVVDPDGGQESFIVVLDGPPVGQVDFSVTSADPGLAEVDTATLHFDPNNWNVPQTVTVTGLDAGLLGQTTVSVRRVDGGASGVFEKVVSVTLAGELDPDLALWLKLNETDGDVAYDSSLYGRDGAIAGSPALGKVGVLARAVGFDESNDTITVPDFNVGPELTVSLWLRLDDNNGTQFQYLYSQGDFGAQNSLSIALGEAGHASLPNQLFVNYRDGNDVSGTLTNILQADAGPNGYDLADGAWHQVVLTVESGAGLRLFIDGRLATKLTTHGGDAFNPDGPITLGTRGDSPFGRYFGGDMDDVRVYDRQLSTEEIVDHYEAVTGTTVPPGPVPPVPPPVVNCDPNRPLDLLYLLDMSGSMTAAYPGAASKFDAALQAIATLNQALPEDGGFTRVALATFQGYNTVAENLNNSFELLVDFTSNLSAVTNMVTTGLSTDDLRPNAHTPTALSLQRSFDDVLAGSDPNNLPVVILLTDGVPNIDLEGRGPNEYQLGEVQAIRLLQNGTFFAHEEVAVTGNFNPTTGTYDGETLADAMEVVEMMKTSLPDLRIYGVAVQGDGGGGHGSFNEDLLRYAAHFTGARTLSAETMQGLLEAMVTVLTDLNCASQGTGTIGDRLWKDLDGDGVQDLGEPGLNGVTVEIFNADGVRVATTVTQGDGEYLFVELPAGTYTVQVVAATLPADAEERTYDLDGIGTSDRATLTVAADELALDVDFGYREISVGPPPPFCPTDGFEDGELDADWRGLDLGDAFGGSAVEESGSLLVTGTGSDLFQDDDNAFLLYQETGGGDFRVEVDLVSFPVDEGGDARKAGLMVRAGTGVRAPRVMLTFIPHHPTRNTTALQFNFRATAGAAGQALANTVFDLQLPVRLAVERRGNVYTAYYSLDSGATWLRPNGGAADGSVAIDMGSNVFAGPVVSSYDPATYLTAEFDEFAICRPNQLPPPVPPPPVPCSPTQPLDVVFLLDMSGSMTADFPGSGGTKFEAAQEAVAELAEALEMRGDGSRAALVSFGGYRDPERNLNDAVLVLSGFTTSFASIGALAESLYVFDIDRHVTTPSAIALHETAALLNRDRNPEHLPVVVWLTDGVPNIDILGNGPQEYQLEEVQEISLYDALGDFRSWGQVQWTGSFNPSLATFDGETLANAMFEVEDLKNNMLDALVYGVSLPGNGIGLGTFNDDIVYYAAYYSGGLAYAVDDHDQLTAAVRDIAGDLDCGGLYTSSLGGLLWQDYDGDGAVAQDEPYLEGVTVRLYDSNDTPLASTVTNSNGEYRFEHLLPGTYTIRVITSTLPLGVTTSTYDPDGTNTPHAVTATVAGGQARLNLYFGYK